ncbi:hypothetical protein BDD26_1108 [Xenorhabdus cabanillasii]|uniref:Uncharacterized protein n=1 Tax=Xenorhabdus cabanillasii TaxID=351673 RepID=A0A3D9UDL8_9GAMM|nr:hypothetical protein [Xenorhabdus cabanillasii]REF26463.1 hypothetical protein BDD26_1108 [Xenorhabdus cabanillasii]
MLLENSLQQDVIASVKKSLTFDHFYQRIKPDISSFISVTSKLSLKNLDDWERLIRWEIYSSLQQYNSQATEIKSQLIGSLRWLDLCNADGFKRERALKILAGGAPNSFLLTLVFRKLNDWVPQVRIAARDVLPLIVEQSDPEIIVDVLFIILPYWNSWGRMGDEEKQILLNIIAMNQVAESLKKRLILSTSGPAATIFSQAGRIDALDTFLAEIAELSVQPALRAKAYRCLLESKFVWAEGNTWQWADKVYGIRRRIPVLNERIVSTTTSFIEYLNMATTDRSPMVRRIAGEMLIKQLENIGEEAFKLAQLLASDKSTAVAERGRYVLTVLAKLV